MRHALKRLRPHTPLVALLGLAAVLRVPWLGVIPNPAGDEGNWSTYALRLLRGQLVALAPEARFVTLLFARLIALAFRLGGPSFTSARAVLVVASLVGIAASWPLARRLCGTAGAAVLAGVLAVHPWAVLWGRTVSVPYALALVTSTLGPLGVVTSLRARSSVGFVLSVQLVAVGVAFSPLALLPLAACALWTLRPGVRNELPAPALALAAGAGALHLVPLALGARTAMAASAHAPAYSEPLLPRLACFVRMVLGELSGEATVAHFAGRATLTEGLGAALVVLVGALALPPALRAKPLGPYAALHLAVALVGLPLLLAPGRAWHMPTIDAERYGFALIAPFALLLCAAASQRGAGRVAAWGFALWLLAVPTLRAAWHFVGRGGHGDQGLYVMRGGGRYRGWQAPAGDRSLPERIYADALRLAEGEPATVVYEDYAFHTLRFVNAAATEGRLGTSLGAPRTPAGRVFTVVWAVGTFAPGYEPASIPVANRTLREAVIARGGQRVSVIFGRDRLPLCELWESRAGNPR